MKVRETERERDTDAHIDRETHKSRQRETHRHRVIERHMQRDTQAQRERERHLTASPFSVPTSVNPETGSVRYRMNNSPQFFSVRNRDQRLAPSPLRDLYPHGNLFHTDVATIGYSWTPLF